MKKFATALSLFGLVGSSAAQTACLSLTSEFPPCAFTCVSSAASAVGCTNTKDLACQCNPQSSSAIQGKALNCVIACGPDAAGSALKAAADICNCVATATQPGTPSTSSTLPGSNSATTTSAKPTGSGTSSSSSGPGSGTTSCVHLPGTTADCGPVASKIPACAQPCFKSAAPKVHCDVTDYACQCKLDAQSSLSQILPACIATACPLDSSTIASIKTAASSLCACATASPSGGGCVTTTTSTAGSNSTMTSASTSKPTGSGGGETITETVHPTETATCDGSCGGQPTGETTSTSGEQPTGTGGGPPVVTAGGATYHYDIGLVVGVAGAFWLAAVAL